MDAILQDVRAALRRLRRSPRFTLAATSLLAIGIGANVVVFSVVHALLVQPLPYADPDRLVRIWESHPELGIFRSAVSRGNFYDWRQRATSFEPRSCGITISFSTQQAVVLGVTGALLLAVPVRSCW